MRRALWVVCVACLVVPGSAFAEPAESQQDWSIGAGAGLVNFSYYAALGRGVIYDNAISGAPSASELGGPIGLTVRLERRLGESSWISLGVLGAHVSRDAARPLRDPALYSYDISSDAEETVVGGILGLRYVFNPLAVVEVGAFGNVGAGRHTLSGSQTRLPYSYGSSEPRVPETLVYDGSGTWLSAGFGLTFEKSLTRQLGLRFSLGVLSVSRTSTRMTGAKDGVASEEQTAAKWDAGLDLSPTLELWVSL